MKTRLKSKQEPHSGSSQVPLVTESSHHQLGACAVVDPTTRAPPQGFSSTGETTTSLESSEEKTGQGKEEGESDGAQCLELTSPTSQTSTVDTPSSADNGYVSVCLFVCLFV